MPLAIQVPLIIEQPIISRNNCLRSASVRAASVVVIALFVAVVAAFFAYTRSDRNSSATEPLLVYCAASVKPPLEAAAREYQKRYGAKIELTFGGSQTLLANVSLSRLGDLYIPADDSYIDLARRKELIGEALPLAEMSAILATIKNQNIQSLADLINSKLTIAQANPDAAAIGKLEDYAQHFMTPQSRKPADITISMIRDRIRVRQTRLPDIAQWLEAYASLSAPKRD